MVKLGFISLNSKSEELCNQLQTYSDIEVVCREEFNDSDDYDAYFILGGDAQLADICNYYMKIENYSFCPVWIYKENCSRNDRLLLYNLGAISVFHNEMDQEEIVKAIHNGLVLVQQNMESDNLAKAKRKNEKYFKMISENLCVLLDNRKTVYLTKMEYKALSILYSSSPKAVPYKKMYEELWGIPYENQKYKIANIIFHLRTKLEKDISSPKIVKTVRSNGYLFNDNYK